MRAPFDAEMSGRRSSTRKSSHRHRRSTRRSKTRSSHPRSHHSPSPHSATHSRKSHLSQQSPSSSRRSTPQPSKRHSAETPVDRASPLLDQSIDSFEDRVHHDGGDDTDEEERRRRHHSVEDIVNRVTQVREAESKLEANSPSEEVHDLTAVAVDVKHQESRQRQIAHLLRHKPDKADHQFMNQLSTALSNEELSASSPSTTTTFTTSSSSCSSLGNGLWYTCGYLVVQDGDQLITESVRHPVDSMARWWTTTGVSPLSGLPIQSIVFDSPDHPCDWALAPHVETGEGSSASESTAAAATGTPIGRQELVNVLMLNVPEAARSEQLRYLGSLSTKELCTMIRSELASNYYALREHIQEWATEVAASADDHEMLKAASLLGIHVHDDGHTVKTREDRERIAKMMLVKILMFQPTGYQKWSKWFSTVLVRKGAKALGFLQQYQTQAALVVLASMCLLGGCAHLKDMPLTEAAAGLMTAYQTASWYTTLGGWSDSLAQYTDKWRKKPSSPLRSSRPD